MKLLTCLSLTFLIVSCKQESVSQNYWKRYNNQPVKTIFTSTTNADFKPNQVYQNTYEFYPNGLLKTLKSKDKYREIKNYYFYQNDTLHSILSAIESNDMVDYTYESVMSNHKKIFPKQTKFLDLYEPYTGKSDAEIAFKSYSYDDKNNLRRVTTQRSSLKDREYFEDYLIKYQKGLISESNFKVFSLKNKKDSVVDFIDNRNYHIVEKSKVGLKKYYSFNQNDTVFYKESYVLFDRKELKNLNIEYLKIEDVLNYFLDDLHNKDISKSTYNIINSKIKTLKDTESDELISSRALQPQSWFIKYFYLNYMENLYKQEKFEEFYNVIDDINSNKQYFEPDVLNYTILDATRVAKDRGDYKRAKGFLNPIYKNSLNNSKQTDYDIFIQALMAQINANLNEKTEAKKTIQNIKDYQDKNSKSLREIDLKNLNYLIAEIYYELDEIENAKALLKSNVEYFKSETDQEGFPIFYEDMLRNEKLLEKIENNK